MVIKQVAEAKCPKVWFTTPEGGPPTHAKCDACQGTGLRWPTLSIGAWGMPDHSIPDVTLEKVLDCFTEGAVVMFLPQFDGTGKRSWICDVEDILREVSVAEGGETRELAACAALLATTLPVSSPELPPVE